MATEVTLKCDLCIQIIPLDNKFINAGSYGTEICMTCFTEMSAAELVLMFGLDDVKVMPYEKWNESVKLPSYIRGNIAKFPVRDNVKTARSIPTF